MVMDIEDYATSFRPDIIDAVSAWCQGATFAKVLTMTDVFEVGTCCIISITVIMATTVVVTTVNLIKICVS